MNSRFVSMACLVFASALLVAHSDDYWTPQGAPGQESGKMKTLEQVEPRKLIDSLPFTINSPGSYYLSQNMFGSSNNVGVEVRSDDVQIDLNGFALIGTNDTLDGILIVGTNQNVTIRNGSIRKWSGFGINGASANDGSVLDIKANRNGLGGILYGEGAMISLCLAYGNGYKAPIPPAYQASNPENDTDADGLNDTFETQIINFDAADVIANFSDVWPWYDAGLDIPPGSEPSIKWDFDGDGADNQMESQAGTDPTNPNDNPNNQYAPMDTDMDGMDDGFEQQIINTNGTDSITTLADVWPWYDPALDNPPGTYSNIYWDFDQDGADNLWEFQKGTDPIDPLDFPSNEASQSEYVNYTEPTESTIDDFEDPTDEPNDDGIRTGAFSTIKECKSRSNRGSGIFVKYASRVVACISAGNMVDGIHASDYGTIINCTAARNNKDGITIGSKCMVKDNNCGQNGDYTMANQMMPEGAGIRILGSGNRVENNNVSGNALGIKVDGTFAVMGMSAGANLIIGNSSVDNWGKAFDLSTGDFIGGEMYQGDVGTATNSSSATMDANNPFSNFNM